VCLVKSREGDKDDGRMVFALSFQRFGLLRPRPSTEENRRGRNIVPGVVYRTDYFVYVLRCPDKTLVFSNSLILCTACTSLLSALPVQVSDKQIIVLKSAVGDMPSTGLHRLKS